MDSSTLKSHSPYKRGADWGAWFGIYLSVLFFVTSYSVSSPVCALIGLLMIIGVPPCIYFMLRKSYVSDNGTTIFSSLWMEGISIFFFGGLIASIVAMIYMRWIDPTFFDSRIDTLIGMYSSMDMQQAQDAADMLIAARDQKLLPKPIELTVDMLWLIVFSGSILSMLMSWLVQLTKVSPRVHKQKNKFNITKSMDISVVVPLYNEAESLPELEAWIDRVMKNNGFSYEILFINDGSTDDSWDVIKRLSQKNPSVRGVCFRRNYGKSPALNTGFARAKGDVVITMDADLQDSPDEIPELYRMITEEDYDLVSGWKQKRYDPLSKTIPTKLFNATARKVSGIHNLHDFNCGLKAYRSKVVKHIEVYGDMHRYIPYLAKNAGFCKIGEKVVHHQARKYGSSKFGLDRFVNGYLDLATLWFTSKFGVKPMHFFGLLGSLMFLLGFIAVAVVGFSKLYNMHHGLDYRLVTDSPYFYLALTLMILGSQLFLAGFIGELVVRNSPGRNHYEIEEEIVQ